MMRPTTKARRPEAFEQLHETADRFERRFSGPFVAAALAARERVTDDEVARSLAAGAPTQRLLQLAENVQLAKEAAPQPSLSLVYRQEISATVLDMVGFVERQMGAPAAEFATGFNVTNPYVVAAAERLSGELIREVSSESRAAVRRIIGDAVRDGVPPREAAKLIRETVGLTERQAAQVAGLRSGLVADGRSVAEVDRLTRRLSSRLLSSRASNIARTETMRAANRGQQALWDGMAQQGVIDPSTFRKRWLTTPDDRICPRCAPMQGKVVSLGGAFTESERGVLPSSREPVAGVTVLTPPLHPRCRCVVVADVG